MIRVLVAEDMHLIRSAIATLLDLEPDIDVVSQVATGDQILAAAIRAFPDVAVIDIDMPNLDGLSAAAAIHDELPEVRTLILTSLGRPGMLRRALSLHVGGFMLKDAPPDELMAAIRQVAAGNRVIDSQLALSAWDVSHCPLTPREVDVLRLIATGADAPEVGRKLFLSAGTVRNNLTNIVAKLNARNRIDAVRIADEAGWL
jgi:two-component system response regulator DesR